jgi:hypothetical protein
MGYGTPKFVSLSRVRFSGVWETNRTGQQMIATAPLQLTANYGN